MKNRFSFLLVICAAAMCLLVPAQHESRAQDNDDNGKHEDPAARARWRFQMRANENGEIPFGALLKARQQMDRLREAAPPRMDAGIGNWGWLGPGNIGGRIRAILIHPTVPSVMWIGSVSGGIWRTNDGGANWFPITDFMANLAVTSLVMDPTNANIIYAATGEGFGNYDGLQGAGIFRSTDGGTIWNQLSSTANQNFQLVNRLAHHPFISGLLLAATATGVWSTTNGGVAWTQVLTPLFVSTDVKFHPANPNNVLVGTGREAYLSRDAGLTWSLETSGAPNKLPSDGGRCEVAFATSDNTMYVSMDRNKGEIWRRTNTNPADTSWTLRNTGGQYLGTQGFYGNVMWVEPTNSNWVIVGGINLWRSYAGGQALTDIRAFHDDYHILVTDPGYNGTTNRTAYVGTDGGIFKTNNILDDPGPYWTNLSRGLGITQFLSGAAALDGSLIVGGAQDNDRPFYTPTRGTNNWGFSFTVDGTWGDGGYTAIDPIHPNRVYGEYNFLAISRSDDGGQSYYVKTNGLADAGSSNLASFVAPFSMDPNSSNILVGGGKRIWRTANYGDNWVQIRDSITSRAMCSAIDIARGSSNTIWVGYVDGTVGRTTNTGGSWTDETTNFFPQQPVTDIAINPTNNNEVFLTFGGYTFNTVWLTTNGGSSWQVRSGSGAFAIPAIQVNTIRFHPTNQNWIYVGTDLGVLASEDKGLTWNVTPRFAGNEGPVNVEVDELFWQGTEYLIAATHGRGMFRTRILPTVYVDINNNGFENGTQQFPYNTIQEGINTAGTGSTISIHAATYPQAPLTFNKRGIIVSTNGTTIIQGPSTQATEGKKK